MGTPRYICITGPDGSGKSTIIKEVNAQLRKKKKYQVEVITIWDMMFYQPETMALLGLKSKENIDRYLELLTPISRSLFLFHIFNQSMAFAAQREADIFLIDSYWYKYFCTEIAHGAEKEKISKITAFFDEPDQTFFLNVSPATAYNRKDKCSGYEIGYAKEHSLQAFIEFQAPVHKEFCELKERYNWFEIDGTDSIDGISDRILQHIEEMMSC